MALWVNRQQKLNTNIGIKKSKLAKKWREKKPNSGKSPFSNDYCFQILCPQNPTGHQLKSIIINNIFQTKLFYKLASISNSRKVAG